LTFNSGRLAGEQVDPASGKGKHNHPQIKKAGAAQENSILFLRQLNLPYLTG
jgi:hypothetical protein